jgi:hypothetical protein
MYENDRRAPVDPERLALYNKMMELCQDPIVAWYYIKTVTAALDVDPLVYLVALVEKYDALPDRPTTDDARRIARLESEVARFFDPNRPGE